MAARPWTVMHLPENGIPVRVPDKPNVIASYTERGFLMGEPAPAPAAEDVPAGTVAEVLAWVGGDAARAAVALDAELAAERPRTSLTSELEALAADGDETATTTDEETDNG